MTYSTPKISAKDLVYVGATLERILGEKSREVYLGGYNDCLCDILHFIRTEIWDADSLPNQLMAEFGPARRVKDESQG